MDDVLKQLHFDLGNDLLRIAKRFKAPKITLVVRNPTLPDGDVVLTDDDTEAVIAAIRRLRTIEAHVHIHGDPNEACDAECAAEYDMSKEIVRLRAALTAREPYLQHLMGCAAMSGACDICGHEKFGRGSPRKYSNEVPHNFKQRKCGCGLTALLKETL